MEDFIAQIRASLDQQLYYLSLFAALTLPDICGALDAPDGRASRQQYEEWYTKWVTPIYDVLTAEECYQYRCTSLHQGTSRPQRSADYDRVLFLEPSPHLRMRLSVKRATAGGETAVIIDLKLFVEAV